MLQKTSIITAASAMLAISSLKHFRSRLVRNRLSSVVALVCSIGAATISNAQITYSAEGAPFEYSGSVFSAARVGDFNGDGHVDIIAQLSGIGGPITLALNDGSGVFTEAEVNPFAVLTPPYLKTIH